MKTKDKRINYAFRFYNEYNELIDKLDGPGNIGLWLGGPDSPFYAAIMAASFEEASQRRNPELLTKTIRIPLDDEGKPMESASEEIIMYESEDIEDAKEFALELGCEYIYWIQWNEARIMAVVESDDEESEYKDFYYFNYE